MKKKMLAILVAAMMSMMFIMPMGSAFAADPDPEDGIGNYSGDSTTPASMDITKNLEVPVGQDTPDTTFTFVTTPMNIDGVAYAAGSPGNMPTVPNRTIEFSFEDDGGTISNSIRTVKKSFKDVFQGVSWPHGGIYEYEITETNAMESGLTYSQAKYQVKVYVDGAAPNCYAKFIVVWKTVDDMGAEEVDPPKSDVAFLNKYSKSDAGTLLISKEVTGLYANTETYFNFSIALDGDSAEATGDNLPYKAYLVNSSGGAIVPAAGNGSGWSAASGAMAGYWYVEIDALDSAVSFSIKPGQFLRVVDLPYGTKYEVQEITPTTYIPSYKIDGGAVETGTKSMTLATGTQTISTPNHMVAYTNNRDEAPPTGLDFNDLPFVGLMILAAGLFAALVAVKVRKATRQRKNFGV
jgi:hypothetical protein